MSFVHGSSARALVNEKEISTELAGWAVSGARNMSEVTTMGQTAGQAGAHFVPGLSSGTLTLRGPQDSAHTVGLTREIKDAIGVDNAFLATCLPDGVAIGKPAHFVLGDPTDWSIDAAVADAVGFSFSAMADEGVDSGYVIHGLGAETADVNGTAVDRGTSLSIVTGSPVAYSVNGMTADIHVTAFSGLTSAAIKIQHSTDNSVWADLVSFTSVVGQTFERVSVAVGTQINRYLRVVTDVTGTGSVTFLVAAAPR
jgi:hypothetical protein